MRTEIYLVKDFMNKAGQEVPEKPVIPLIETQILRSKLHAEEAVTELQDAFDEKDPVKVLDSICDSLVVVFGTALACGFTPDQVTAAYHEVMRSNMSKFIDGHRRTDGKWVKGPSYSPANLEQFLK